jgi:hypothetical protein
LDSDTRLKVGQIAHLDHDANNSVQDNLAFLCLEHHDLYDSSTSQSKGLTQVEARQYRAGLYEYVAQQRQAGLFVSGVRAGGRGAQRLRQTTQFGYERRLAVYRTVTRLLGKIYRDVTVEYQDLSEYVAGIDEALFLFDEAIERYLRLLYERSVHLRFLHGQMSSTREISTERRAKLAEEEAELLKWFVEQSSELRRRLRPFFQLA